ncbi:MAG: ATP-binding protein, partial [Pseudobdellovibrio sp.]
LFNNSIYALSKTTFPKIEVQFVEDEDYFHLYFSDNGPGVPSDCDTKIFAPFFTTKPVGAGTGLGLSISNKIIQSYGGSLKLDRTRGNSCFHIKLSKMHDHKNIGTDAEIFKFSS